MNGLKEKDIEELKAFLVQSKGEYTVTIVYNNEKRRIYYLPKLNQFGILLKGKRKQGNFFSDWTAISKVHYPPEKTAEYIKEQEYKLVQKYKKLARQATFTNSFIRDCLNADLSKNIYENKLTTGTIIDGKVISLSAIGKVNLMEEMEFRAALKDRKNYRSSRFPFRGYEATLELIYTDKDDCDRKAGDITGRLSVEYKGCGNGYYYMLINDEQFIGYDKD